MIAPLRSFPLLLTIAIALVAWPTALRAQVVINEVLPSNAGVNTDEDGDSSDWVELKNLGDEPVDVEGYVLSDDINDLEKWVLPAVEIPAGGYLLIWCSGKDRSVGI